MSGRTEARRRMTDAGVDRVAIDVFTHHYDQLTSGATGLIPEETIEPVVGLPRYEDIDVTAEDEAAALDGTAVIVLNGGLGTSMGMRHAKSLLPVRGDLNFLDITARQVLAARAATGARLPLLLMNSFSTRADSLAALARYPELPVDGLPLDFLQSKEPKLRADDLAPVDWPSNPAFEWCPPGHGDIYPSLLSSGVLDLLLANGFHTLFVSNADNLGATPDGRIAAWFAASGAPYAAEVTPRTPMDRKGGHVARRRTDGRLVLRDTAQTPKDELRHFMDEARHPYAHCNNLWLDLRTLAAVLSERGGVLGLPIIRNEKTVDPRDPSSTAVIQVETSMGTAIEVFDGATALVVPRSRFLPVKGTSELLLARSDAYRLDDSARLTLAPERQGLAPVVALESPVYKTIDGLEERFPSGPPSLVEAQRLTVEGDYTFDAGVVVRGDVTLPPTTAPEIIRGTLGA